MSKSESMFVYGGECRLGKCGAPTKMHDVHYNSLCVGDIVLSFTQGINDDYMGMGDLTVVVSDKYTTCYDGTHKIKKGKVDYFVMGIKGAFPGGEVTIEEDKWNVLKVKSWDDVIDGEHWKSYGFNFKLEQEIEK